MQPLILINPVNANRRRIELGLQNSNGNVHIHGCETPKRCRQCKRTTLYIDVCLFNSEPFQLINCAFLNVSQLCILACTLYPAHSHPFLQFSCAFALLHIQEASFHRAKPQSAVSRRQIQANRAGSGRVESPGIRTGLAPDRTGSGRNSFGTRPIAPPVQNKVQMLQSECNLMFPNAALTSFVFLLLLPFHLSVIF